MDAHGLTQEELAAFLGVSRVRVSQMISAARRKGNPVPEPLTLPEQPHVALAIITSDRGVLVARRRDGIPPWTFIGGEIQPGETSGDALRRKVQGEAGLPVEAVRFIGRRIHPKTSRVMVYGHVEGGAGRRVGAGLFTAPRTPPKPSGVMVSGHAEGGEGDPQLGDAEDLAEV